MCNKLNHQFKCMTEMTLLCITASLKRLELPTDDTITSFSNELGAPRTTIYQWKKRKNNKSNKNKSVSKWILVL